MSDQNHEFDECSSTGELAPAAAFSDPFEQTNRTWTKINNEKMQDLNSSLFGSIEFTDDNSKKTTDEKSEGANDSRHNKLNQPGRKNDTEQSNLEKRSAGAILNWLQDGRISKDESEAMDSTLQKIFESKGTKAEGLKAVDRVINEVRIELDRAGYKLEERSPRIKDATARGYDLVEKTTGKTIYKLDWAPD